MRLLRRKMNIGLRLTAAFLVIAFLTLTSGVIGIVGFWQATDAAKTLVDNSADNRQIQRGGSRSLGGGRIDHHRRESVRPHDPRMGAGSPTDVEYPGGRVQAPERQAHASFPFGSQGSEPVGFREMIEVDFSRSEPPCSWL